MSASAPSTPTAAPTGSVPSGETASPAVVPSPSPAQPTSDSEVYAIVEASGQQFWLRPNRYIDIDRLDAEVSSGVSLDTVLLVKGSTGITLGQPYVAGAKVDLTVIAHRRGPKILVYKMRRKKKTRRKTGHRQELTRVMVNAIHVNGKPIS
ncbi:MAG: 50S ribosomal protein L21 [Cyanobacteriota bacterium]|jgi:large subunit ribosomal protein L21